MILKQASDKLDEARFFLERVARSGGDGQEFRFNMSALLSASRSVTWVLRTELSRQSGSSSTDWLQSRLADIESDIIPFATLANLRNVSQKEGNRLPRIVKEVPVGRENDVLADIEFRFELSDTTHINSEIQIHFREGRAPHVDVEDDAEEHVVRKAHEEAMVAALGEVAETMKTGGMGELKFKGYALDDDPESPVLDFSELIAGFSTYLDTLGSMISDAERELDTKR